MLAAILFYELNNEFFVDKELACLMQSVNRVGTAVQKAYGADALTIACQVQFFSFFFSKRSAPFFLKRVSI